MSKVRAEQYTNRAGSGAPEIPYGVTVPSGASIDGAGGLNLTGIATAGSFKGNLTGDVTGDVSGNVTGVAATFSGPVTIGGTLTYEDVTNIDSVGVITARDGVNVSSGDIDVTSGNVKVGTAITAYGSTGIISATSYRGDGSQLSGIEAAPTIQAVANGTIAAESSLIVQSDGKVANITAYAEALGTPNNYYSSDAHQWMSDFDSVSGKLIVCYATNATNNHMRAKVGTVSGTSITYGSETTVSTGANNQQFNRACSMACGNGKVVVIMADRNGGTYFTARAGSIDPTANSGAGSITWGTAVDISSGQSDMSSSICYDSDKDRFVCVYANNGTSNLAKSTILSVSGNTITKSDANREVSGGYSACHITVIYVPEKQAYYLAYTSATGEDPATCHSGTGYPRGVVGTINSTGDTMSWGSQQQTLGTDNKIKMCLAYVPSIDRIAVAYLDRYHSYKLESMVITVDWSAKTSSINNYSVIESSGNCEFAPIITCISDTDDKVVVAYNKSPGLVSNVGTVNPTTGNIAWAGSTTLDSSGTVRVGNMWGEKNFPKVGPGKFAITARDDSGGESWQLIKQFAATDVTTGNFIGFSKEAYTNGQTATVKVVGNVTTQSGLTPGTQYYVQNDGTLGSTAASPSVEAGKALTATSLLIKG